MRRGTLVVSAAVLTAFLWLSSTNEARAQNGPQTAPLDRFAYYPYYYFPHDYWPTQGPKWPESPGQPYMPPPAYMAYPPFHEPNWRYEMNTPHKYYRGFHFWLDQF
jgi:hypothetical protein